MKQALALIADTCIRYVHDILQQDIDGFSTVYYGTVPAVHMLIMASEFFG
ncbi:hypothetical protein [Serratia ficaria]|nr:hypothetical protein [Serratia ficaria]